MALFRVLPTRRTLRAIAASAPFFLAGPLAAAPDPLAAATARYARYRATLDGADLAAAEALVTAALAVRPSDYELGKLRLRLLLPRHRFGEMVEGARALAAEHPNDPDLDETLGDAFMELGRYDEAFAAYERLAAARPGAATWSRIALARAVGPDLDAAVAAMDLAAEAARGRDAEAFAWCRAQGARLLLREGKRTEAAGRVAEALRAFPAHAASLAAAAEIAAREGRLAEACALAESSLERAPDMFVAAALVDYRVALGDAEGRARAEALLRTMERLLPEEERLVNRPLALFEAEHGDAARALEMARREMETRRDVAGLDAFAWAAFRNGRVEEAGGAMREALARGTVDPMLEWHAGVIAAAAGDDARARCHLSRALALDPGFHVLHARDARRLLDALEGTTR